MVALEHGIPIIVMPRRADLGEQRNDHQLATAHRFGELALVHVATDERTLRQRLDGLDELARSAAVQLEEPTELVTRLRSFIESGE